MKAMILAAGKGRRMGQLTQQTPKPLLTVGGHPLLFHHLQRLKMAGFTDIVINVSYLAEQLKQYLESRPVDGLRIQISVESDPLETAGGIIQALSFLGQAPFICINGDVWTDYPFAQLQSLEDIKMAHLVLVKNPEHHLSGDFGLSKEVKMGLQLCNLTPPYHTFSGISVLNPSLFSSYMAKEKRLGSVLKQAIEAKAVSGECYDGLWMDVGTPERLQSANQIFAEEVRK